MGWKFNEWELKGVPLRIEIGEKEIKKNKATFVRRDNGEKREVAFRELALEVGKELESIQDNLFEKSRQNLQRQIKEVSDYKTFKKIMKEEKGFIKAFWCGGAECESKIKKETKATIRCLPFDAPEENGECVFCRKKSREKWIFGQAY